mmetsp:Transcript_7853/g.28918  ORF Transcript_7853/g.28918 Transcript_7853/m.28918 type:complete len:244 (-) Transcript_7853:633-1364(-)
MPCRLSSGNTLDSLSDKSHNSSVNFIVASKVFFLRRSSFAPSSGGSVSVPHTAKSDDKRPPEPCSLGLSFGLPGERDSRCFFALSDLEEDGDDRNDNTRENPARKPPLVVGESPDATFSSLPRDFAGDFAIPNIFLGGVTGSSPVVDASGFFGLAGDAALALLSSNGASHVPFVTASYAHLSLNSCTAAGRELSSAAALNNQHIFVANRKDRRQHITIMRSKLDACCASAPPSSVRWIHIVTI